MEDKTHSDKLALINGYLYQLGKDVDKLDPVSIDNILYELESLINFTGNHLYYLEEILEIDY